jgi:methylated-DNA-[protein]-cysteine S-methyltransferase
VRFSVPLDLSGHTAFRMRVWRAMQRIPFGRTWSYGELGRRAGCRSARAIGQACGANPVPILIPCHRVVGASGLGGWSGARGWKTKLLALEGRPLSG